MSAANHASNNVFKPLSLCVLTVSDSRTADNDTSGDYLCDALRDGGHQLHERAIVRDDKYAMRALVDEMFNEVVCGRMTPKQAGDRLDAAGVPFDVQCRVLCGATKEIAA